MVSPHPCVGQTQKTVNIRAGNFHISPEAFIESCINGFSGDYFLIYQKNNPLNMDLMIY